MSYVKEQGDCTSNDFWYFAKLVCVLGKTRWEEFRESNEVHLEEKVKRSSGEVVVGEVEVGGVVEEGEVGREEVDKGERGQEEAKTGGGHILDYADHAEGLAQVLALVNLTIQRTSVSLGVCLKAAVLVVHPVHFYHLVYDLKRQDYRHYAPPFTRVRILVTHLVVLYIHYLTLRYDPTVDHLVLVRFRYHVPMLKSLHYVHHVHHDLVTSKADVTTTEVAEVVVAGGVVVEEGVEEEGEVGRGEVDKGERGQEEAKTAGGHVLDYADHAEGLTQALALALVDLTIQRTSVSLGVYLKAAVLVVHPVHFYHLVSDLKRQDYRHYAPPFTRVRILVTHLVVLYIPHLTLRYDPTVDHLVLDHYHYHVLMLKSPHYVHHVHHVLDLLSDHERPSWSQALASGQAPHAIPARHQAQRPHLLPQSQIRLRNVYNLH
ncbi:hypothetical protein FIBSPDRAFT_946319 [Athelia psychrophila]|uniref:Uncharacterized protein n=1 Tax=Athelia psychrophila TaxID=1759441 RepID=A0A166T6A9_9AGAM|nr:hypothetical protein FIBSPDRAFT_946319 [Fibularhizoctonia sp. CBS 109695]